MTGVVVDLLEFRLMFMLLVVGVVLFVIIRLVTGPRPAPYGEQQLCRACGASHPSFARFCRRCGRQL